MTFKLENHPIPISDDTIVLLKIFSRDRGLAEIWEAGYFAEHLDMENNNVYKTGAKQFVSELHDHSTGLFLEELYKELGNHIKERQDRIEVVSEKYYQSLLKHAIEHLKELSLDLKRYSPEDIRILNKITQFINLHDEGNT